MARSYLDKIGLGHLWDLIKSYFVKGNAKVFTGICFSDASATDKVVTCSEFASTDLIVGAIISVKFINTNSATASSITLNVNNTGSKGIRYIYNGLLNTIPNGNFLKANQLYQFTYDGTYWVVQLMYNTDTTSALRDDYGRYTAGSVGLFPYTLVMQLPDGRWESIVTSSSNGTSKTKNSHGFLVNTVLFKGSNLTITENKVDSTWYIYEHPSVCDYRYSFNIENTTALALVAGKPIYLVGTIKADGLFYLADTWWTQTLPSTDDGKVYIYLGQVFDWYRGTLLTNHPIYLYKDGHVTNYINNDTLVNVDQQPYSFRKSGGGVVVGDTEYDKIVGASVVLNQFVQNGNFADKTGWSTSASSLSVANNVLTITKNENTGNGVGYARRFDISYKMGHKYFATVDYKGIPQKQLTVFSNFSGAGMTSVIPIDDQWHTVTKVFNIAETPSVPGILWLSYTTTTDDNVAQFKNYNIIDLTQFFGSATIADYVYGLEHATTGAGVAWLKKYFPKVFDNGYIPYNTGSFEHVKGLQSHKMVGFNQFNKSTATVGKYVGANGVIGDDSKCFVTDFINVEPNTDYYTNHIIGTALHTAAYVEYDSDKNVVSWGSIGSGSDRVAMITTGASTRYIRVNVGVAYLDSTCINISDASKNGTYEPYDGHSYALDSTLTLKGKFELDENDNLIADGDTYEADGKITRNIIEVDLSTLSWSTRYTGTTNKMISANLPSPYVSYPTSMFKGIVCENYNYNGMVSAAATLSSPDDAQIGIYVYTNPSSSPNNRIVYLVIGKDETPKGNVIYFIATPTIEYATPYQNPQSVDERGTEEYVSTSLIPIGHYTEYTVSKNLVKNVSSDFDNIATQDKFGYMSASDKTKLDGIETGAEVNQNAFSNVKVGTTTISADTKTDTLELSAGTNITLTPDTTNDKVTINATDTKYSAGDGIGLNGTTFSNTGVTGIKGNAESSYRTGQVNLTAANVGAVATTGNETVSGNKTFSGTTTITPSSTFSSKSGDVVSANSSAIIQSPIPKYLWHDIWAFCRVSTPKYYTSADGSTWVEGTLEKNLFAHKEAWGVSNVLSSSIKGSRWTWLNGGFYASQASWIVLGVTYKNPSAHFDLLLETSSNGGSTWSTMLSVTNLYYVQTPIWIKNSATCQDSLRLTLTWNNNSVSNAILGLCSIRFLTSRWGDQGKGGEFEYPFAWDRTPNIYPIRGDSDLGTSSNKWNNVNANNFNGNFTGNVTGNVTGDVTGRTSSMLIQNITSNANLNTITTDGWYMASTDAIASSLSNCPSTKSFLMEVYHINSATGSNEVIYQKISTSENIHYERIKATGTWSEWKSSCHIDLNGVVYI